MARYSALTLIEPSILWLGRDCNSALGAARCTTKGCGDSGESWSAADVLLVEDNDDVAHSLTVLMSFKGVRVVSVRNGPQALEYVTRFEPLVILIDIGLPGMDGLELAAKLRGDPAGSRKLLIGLSGHSEFNWGKSLAAAGFDAYFTKPADVDELCSLIANFLAAVSSMPPE